MDHGVTWSEAMRVLDFAQLHDLPVEVRAVDEDRGRWTVTIGSRNAQRHGKAGRTTA